MKNEDIREEESEILTPQWLVLGEIDALLSFWPLVSGDPDIGPRQAVNILSTWAHLRRFPLKTTDESLVERLNVLVRSDPKQLAEAALRFAFPENWPESAEELDEVWDFVVESDQIDDLERSVREMFYSLDRFSLALYAVERLVPELRANPRFMELRHRLENAEEYLQINPDVFLSAAVYASTLFNSYKSDLYEFDERLWETTLKHRQLQELLDEGEIPSSRQHSPADLIFVDDTQRIQDSLLGKDPSEETEPIDVVQADTEPETKLVQLGPSGSAWLSFQLEFLLVELGRASSLRITFDGILINSGTLQLISRPSLSNKQFELRLSDGVGECKRSLKAVIEPFHFKVTGNSVPSIRVSLWFQGKQTSTVKTLKFEGNKF